MNALATSATMDKQPGALKNEMAQDQKDKSNSRLMSAERFEASAHGTVGSTSASKSVQQVNGNIALNFVNVSLQDFLQAVLGEILHLNYIVDPSAQGAVTLETTQPIKKEAVLPTVESALQLNGLTLVEINGIYNVMPKGSSTPKASLLPSGGYRAKIIPLRYVNVTDMQQVLETLAPSGSVLRADPTHNIFIIAGNSHDIDSVAEAISTFDVDTLSGLSFGLYPIKNTTVKRLTSELQEVLSGTTVANMVKLTSLDRLNALLVSSKQRHYIDETEKWITRLDRVGEGNQESLYVYRVQNGRASDLVSVLEKAFLGRASEAGSSKSSVNTPPSKSVNQNDDFVPIPQISDIGGPRHKENTTSSEPSDIGNGTYSTSNGILRITADEINNAILIYSTPEGYRIVESALKNLDISPLQVLIEVAITEVTLNDDLRYGVQYFFSKGQHSLNQIENKAGLLAEAFPGFNYTWTGSQKIQTILSLLGKITNVKMLASPQLLVLNNQRAHIIVGDQVPVATQSAMSTLTSSAPIVNSIEYKNTGINLNVTPRVNAGGLVLLDISQEVSGVTQTTSSTLDSPTIQQRMITSSVAVSDEETIALGGLIKEQQDQTKSGIPLLQDIPYLGALFSVEEISKARTELLVLITPHVIKNTQDGKDITEEVRSKISSLSIK